MPSKSSNDSFSDKAKLWWEGIKTLPQTTSIHGFKFITDESRHWTERVFWTFFVVMSWYGSFKLIFAQYDTYQNNQISFVVETTYKDWNTDFPTIAVCETDNPNRIEEVSDRLWGSDHNFNIEEVLKELSYFRGTAYYTPQFCGPESPIKECMTNNISYYVDLVRGSCEDTIDNCYWNDMKFKCCDYFRPIDTEYGLCYALNSIQGRERKPLTLPMISNRTSGPGGIKFDVLVLGNVYIMNEEDVPSFTSAESDVLLVKPEVFYRRYISIRNIENDDGVRYVAPEKRKCRYYDEPILDVYRYYSYTACTVQCRKEAQMQLCNCTSYFMPNVPEYVKCDVNGVICLNEYKTKLSIVKELGDCNCLPSCSEAEITIVKDFKDVIQSDFATVYITLSNIPSERFRRNVVRGVLDLVVLQPTSSNRTITTWDLCVNAKMAAKTCVRPQKFSIGKFKEPFEIRNKFLDSFSTNLFNRLRVSTGGTGGLFLGASLLSFVELLYIMILRPCFNIYAQRGDDRWHKKFGTRKLEDNKFKPKFDWSYVKGN